MLAIALLTQNFVGKNLGVIGAAAFGALIAFVVVFPIAATRRYRCADCGAAQPRPGRTWDPERLGAGWIVAVTAAAVLGVILLLVLANLRAHMYPQQVREQFLAACMGNGGATEASCGCALNATERTYSLDEFIVVEAALEKGGALPERLRTLYAAC